MQSNLVGAANIAPGVSPGVTRVTHTDKGTPTTALCALADGASCTAPDLVAALGALPPGRVMAPIDMGGVAIAFTRQRLIAGAYHRDGAGDLAMYAFYRGTPDNAARIARDWRVDYVVACDGFGDVAAPLVVAIERGLAPGWLRPVANVKSGGRIFATVAGSAARP